MWLDSLRNFLGVVVSSDVHEEAERVYAGIWPKHPAYDDRNVREIEKGLLRVRGRDLACPHPHRSVERLGRTMYLSHQNSVWEWCSDCGAVRRVKINEMNFQMGEPEAWRRPGEPAINYLKVNHGGS